MNLSKFCSPIVEKVKLAKQEIVYLAKTISKQNVIGATWFVLTTYRKKWEEKNKLKEFFVKKNKNIKIWKL